MNRTPRPNGRPPWGEAPDWVNRYRRDVKRTLHAMTALLFVLGVGTGYQAYRLVFERSGFALVIIAVNILAMVFVVRARSKLYRNTRDLL